VKEEDADWMVYHRIPENGPVPEDALVTACGLDRGIVTASLARLERSCLIERSGGNVRMLSFGEALLKNQCRYEPDLPYRIENGVIKARKN
jgi:hypothetical protein